MDIIYTFFFICLHSYTILLQTLGRERKPRFSSIHRDTSQQKFTHSDSLRDSILCMISSHFECLLRKTGISQALLKADILPSSLSCQEQWLKSCISINTGLDTVFSTCYITESNMLCSETICHQQRYLCQNLQYINKCQDLSVKI